MAVWVIRGGRDGEFEDGLLTNKVVAIDYGFKKNIANFACRQELRQHLMDSNEYPHLETLRKAGKAAGRLWSFYDVIAKGDLVVLPRKSPKVVAVGKITGEYRYDLQAEETPPHVRDVVWQSNDIPRANFDSDLLYSMGGLSAIFQIRREDADLRLSLVMNTHLGNTSISEQNDAATITDDIEPVDLREYVSDRIIERIRQKFTGHRLEYLVTSILKAEGYTALQTRPSRDGGVDVVAGSGELGFSAPRLCVQVKSSSKPIGIEDYHHLQISVNSFGADHGLLVSLSDFEKPVRNENEKSFFKVRLWGPAELEQRLVGTYAQLPADIRADIPLVNMWIPIETELDI